jgi:hypothetical protein
MATRTIRRDEMRGPYILPEEAGQMCYDEWYSHPDGPVAIRIDRSLPHGQQTGPTIQYAWSARAEFAPQNGVTAAIGRGRRVVIVD